MVNDNLLLARLPPEVRARLHPRFERIALGKGQRLYEMGEPVSYALFPTGGMISLESGSRSGRSVQLTTVGQEGMIGVPLLFGDDVLPCRVVVRVGAPAFHVRASTLLAELGRHALLSLVLRDYAARMFREVSQAAVCHRTHSLQQRVCRVLLTAADHLEATVVHLTQEDLGHTLGTDRTVINRIIDELQDAGAIASRYGRISIRKRPMLEATVCECYRTLFMSRSAASPLGQGFDRLKR